MTITFYIQSKGKRTLKFETAGALDLYVKTRPLPKSAMIVLKDESDKVQGTMTVQNYLQYENERTKRNLS